MRFTKYHMDLGYCTTTRYANESAKNKHTEEVYVSGMAINRLGEFENILCADDNSEFVMLDRIRELVDADRDNRVVVLPKPLTAGDIEAIRDIGRIANNLDMMARLNDEEGSNG